MCLTLCSDVKPSMYLTLCKYLSGHVSMDFDVTTLGALLGTFNGRSNMLE